MRGHDGDGKEVIYESRNGEQWGKCVKGAWGNSTHGTS